MVWQPKPPLTNVYQLLDANICSICGACIAACPWSAVSFSSQQPSQVSRDIRLCTNCSRCLIVCPQTILWIRRDLYTDDAKIVDAYLTRSKDSNILSIAQDGGTVTALAVKALERKLVDAAVLAGTEDKWIPRPTLALSPDDVLKCAKSKYFYVPSLMELRRFDWVRRIMVVGLPCQIRAIEKLEDLDVGISRRIMYKVGLFCGHNLDYASLIEKLLPKAGVGVESLSKMNVKGKVLIYDKAGGSYELPLSEYESLTRPSCLQCPEFVSRSADVNVGSIGAPDGWNMVLVMSRRGEELFNASMDALEVKKPTSDDLDRVYRMDRRKRERSSKFFKDFYGVDVGTMFLDRDTWRVISR
ncbi:MAG: Coenzyme F420 hydrogenase/dehydrogenase, beta subunit C-terminal domain [Candidatus Nezhaarchaeota archaeon]|nr:Coenzyme F420 hydrogenase/dehydrogenase, beta subunit C-terminal domain [Candidatus Nezhaarchaeota archaeon]MCX8142353.1 Coenzyme F420 hydrogenase/dehydrogenase, beta subunit C-terminal domain [Candidatus Nezhaarchaeota archaeon]MDW8050674.1 Coenzyme F420 hydrogenase/dehydrogenase, beta subunit C-terminal domain [Nitrososphaerota archaeon]